MYYLIAHRGNGMHMFPENTKEALLFSLKEPYVDGIELDVRMTKDNKFIILHNSFLLTEKGIQFIKHMKGSEIRKINLKKGGKDYHIPFLKEVLKEIDGNKKIVIELKVEDEKIEVYGDMIYPILKKYSYLNLYICSFHKELLLYMKKKYPMFRYGIISFLPPNKSDTYFDFVSYFILHLDQITFQKETILWTVNHKNQLEEIKKRGLEKVDIDIMTDHPEQLKPYL